MSGVAGGPPGSLERARPWLALLGVLLAVAVLVPPLAGLARAHEVLDALQFAVLAIAAPALVVLGAPWRLAARLERRAGAVAARRRASPPGTWAGISALVVELVAVVAWRTPAAVGALGQHRWLVALEAVTLLAAGVALWLGLVASPPIAPSARPPRRMVLATLAMWTVWIVAYVAGMAHGEGYPGFVHVAGRGLGAVADKQLATAVLWGVAAGAYLPVVFCNLFAWLGAEERRGDESSGWRGSTRSPRADEVRTAH